MTRIALLTVLITLVAASSAAYAWTPAPWPGSGSNTTLNWVAYRDISNNYIQDPNDMSPDHLDLVFSTSDPAAVSVAFDGYVTFYRFQLEDSPIAKNGSWNNGTWIVQYGSATSGFVGAAYLNVVGQTGTIAISDGSSTDVIYTFSANNTSPNGASVTAVPGSTNYYLDFQIPLAALASGTNTQLGLTANTVQSFYYGTSAAAGNPTQISKDFMIGTTVDFSAIAQSMLSSIGIGVLPVELTSFKAYRKAGVTELRWNTATEIDNYGFAVERSLSGEDWTEIGFVAGSGTSNTPRSYGFTDAALPRDAGSMYYRLRQIDRDGSTEHSSIVMVSLAERSFTGITDAFPNPFNPSTTVSYTVADEGAVRLTMMDVTGRTLLTVVDEAAQSAGSYSVTLNADNLPSGRYFLVFMNKENQSIYPVMLMK
jgi:hypothetical protein